MTPTFTKTEQQVRREFLIMDAFASIALSGTARKFPGLRFGFVESASAWLPYLLWFVQIEKTTLASQERGEAVVETYNTLLEDQRLFVTCESTEDLHYVIAKAGDNNLMVGSDYSHVDRSARGSAHQEIVDYSGLPQESIRRLTETNARRFYGL
jgi:predicted TIM-barrel fold metal-dependent hydrolase